MGLAEGAIEPGGHERDDDAVAELPGRYSRADGSDFTGAVRARDSRDGPSDAADAENVHVVPVVEGDGANLDDDLTSGGHGR